LKIAFFSDQNYLRLNRSEWYCFDETLTNFEIGWRSKMWEIDGDGRNFSVGIRVL